MHFIRFIDWNNMELYLWNVKNINLMKNIKFRLKNGGNEVVKSTNSKRARFRSIWARDPGHACKNENEKEKKYPAKNPRQTEKVI